MRLEHPGQGHGLVAGPARLDSNYQKVWGLGMLISTDMRDDTLEHIKNVKDFLSFKCDFRRRKHLDFRCHQLISRTGKSLQPT